MFMQTSKNWGLSASERVYGGPSTNLLIQEGNAGFNTPCRGRLVGTQAVRKVEVLDSANSLLMESLLVRRSVEVEVTAEDLVTALATQDHLHAQRLDLPAQKEHGRGSTDCGNIVGLEVVDDIGERVKSVFSGEGQVVVLGAEEVSNFLR